MKSLNLSGLSIPHGANANKSSNNSGQNAGIFPYNFISNVEMIG